MGGLKGFAAGVDAVGVELERLIPIAVLAAIVKAIELALRSRREDPWEERWNQRSLFEQLRLSRAAKRGTPPRDAEEALLIAGAARRQRSSLWAHRALAWFLAAAFVMAAVIAISERVAAVGALALAFLALLGWRVVSSRRLRENLARSAALDSEPPSPSGLPSAPPGEI